MNRDPAVREFFPGLMSYDQAAEMITRLEHHFDQYKYGFYAMDLLSTGEFIGFTGLSQPSFQSWFTPCVEIGWRLKQEAWGCGYATEAALACLQHGWEGLGLERIYSFAVAGNIRSERVMQKIGMKKHGEFDHPNLDEGSSLRRHLLYVAEPSPERVGEDG
jgi:ribosomal-protein-alanine N-acetyltransferase